MLIFIAQVITKMLIFFSFIIFIKHFHRGHNSVSHTEGKINNSRGVYLFQSLNRPGVYLGTGSSLEQTFNSLLTKIQDENVTNFSSSSVNSPASCWAVVVFCKWSCCGRGNDPAAQHPQITPHLCCHSRWRTFVSPSSRQPGPVAVLLGQLRFILSPISHSLGVDRETSSGCFSRLFLCIFYGRKFEFQAVLFFFCSSSDSYYVAMETDTLLPQTWRFIIFDYSNCVAILPCVGVLQCCLWGWLMIFALSSLVSL